MGDNREAVDVGIFDIRGKKVYSENDLMPDGKIVWDAGGETSGVYLIRLSNTTETITARVVYVK